jgi:hypothetical protein
MRWALLFVCAVLASADERVQKMTARLAEEAEAFAKLAPQVLARETLTQDALRPPSRFRPRIGAAATQAPKPQLQHRVIISEYGFAALASAQSALREFREVVSVDGKSVAQEETAMKELAANLTAPDDERKKKMLKKFEKLGLRGAATDFGPMLLLFNRRGIERFEFAWLGTRALGQIETAVFSYKQIDGPDLFTVIEADQQDRTVQMRLEGEVWVRETDFLPIRITVSVTRGLGAASIRNQAIVQYLMSNHGALLPSEVLYRELRGGQPVSTNHFRYDDYRRFSASADIKFEPDK